MTPVGNVSCQAGGTCENYDAIVFVHGIYGGDDTFANASTHFDWAQQFPRRIRERWVDVFHLTYKTELLT